MSAAEYKRSNALMEALIVLADATEYWHFGGKQTTSQDLSFWIESGKARLVVERALVPLLLLRQWSASFEMQVATSADEEPNLLGLLTLLSPRLKQLHAWMAQKEEERCWPSGFQLIPWNTEHFADRAEWREEKQFTLAFRKSHMEKMLYCLETLKDVEPLLPQA
jgi:hypothetical protein